jgi:hypothetical protein
MKILVLFMTGLVVVKDVLINLAIVSVATFIICLFGFSTLEEIKTFRSVGGFKRKRNEAA